MATYLQQQLEEVSAQYGIAKFAFNVRGIRAYSFDSPIVDHLFLPIQERITTRIGLVFRLKQALEDAQIEKGLTGLVISFTSKESGVDMNGNLVRFLHSLFSDVFRDLTTKKPQSNGYNISPLTIKKKLLPLLKGNKHAPRFVSKKILSQS